MTNSVTEKNMNNNLMMRRAGLPLCSCNKYIEAAGGIAYLVVKFKFPWFFPFIFCRESRMYLCWLMDFLIDVSLSNKFIFP